MTAPIHSDRLDLIPMTPSFLRASLAGRRREAEQELALSLPPDWPGESADVLALRLQQLEVDPAEQPWLLRAMTLRGTGVMVGHIGFHAAPGADSGGELGFLVFDTFRRRGYAREAALALMHWARESRGVRRFVLSIRPDNAASQALAAQLGFVRTGSQLDAVDGLEDILEFKLPDQG